MLDERDTVLRLVKQFAEAIARALKLAREARPAQARIDLRSACAETLGIEHAVLAMLDAQSARELLGSAERVKAYVQLLEAMAEVEARAGDELAALALRHRAEEVSAR